MEDEIDVKQCVIDLGADLRHMDIYLREIQPGTAEQKLLHTMRAMLGRNVEVLEALSRTIRGE